MLNIARCGGPASGLQGRDWGPHVLLCICKEERLRSPAKRQSLETVGRFQHNRLEKYHDASLCAFTSVSVGGLVKTKRAK